MKKTIRTTYILCTLLASLSAYCKNDPNIIIDSAILHAADGIFFTKDDVGILLQLREYLRKLLYGIKNSDGTPSGPLMIDNNPHCLRTLCDIEREFSPADHAQLITNIIQKFNKETEESRKRGKGVKTQQRMYIEESCRLHNKTDKNCILLAWAKAPEDKEDYILDLHVHSIKDKARFVIDLMNFLDDMISSCPKARKQFLASIPNPQERIKIEKLLTHIFTQQKNKIHNAHTQKS